MIYLSHRISSASEMPVLFRSTHNWPKGPPANTRREFLFLQDSMELITSDLLAQC